MTNVLYRMLSIASIINKCHATNTQQKRGECAIFKEDILTFHSTKCTDVNTNVNDHHFRVLLLCTLAYCQTVVANWDTGIKRSQR